VQLTRSPTRDTGPLFSPDGRRILFLRSYTELWVMKADGTGKRRLAADTEGGVWSPDSGRIAYAARRGLVIASIDGRHRYVGPGWKGAPAWSPDGKRLAILTSSDGRVRTDLAVVRSDGRGLRTIRRDVGGGPVTWLPRGLISFTAQDRSVNLVRPDG